MVKNTLYTVLFVLFGLNTLSAQEFAYGFKAGLNFSQINTDDIEQFDGQDLENFTQNSGFHLGAVLHTRFSDYFGVSLEFLFSQKGGRYAYEGPSYSTFNSFVGDEKVTEFGFRTMNLNTSNSYFDMPVSVYVKPVKWFELSAGANVAILLSSTASGELIFRQNSQNEDDAFRGITLDYRYFSDEPGETADGNIGSEVRMVNGVSLKIPKTITAYFDYPDGAETGLYKRFDVGVHAGMKFFINSSLFVGGRVNWGLRDITKEGVDRSLQDTDGDDLVFRDDNDTNLSIQASIGFSF